LQIEVLFEHESVCSFQEIIVPRAPLTVHARYRVRSGVDQSISTRDQLSAVEEKSKEGGGSIIGSETVICSIPRRRDGISLARPPANTVKLYAASPRLL